MKTRTATIAMTHQGLWGRYQQMRPSHKFLVTVFIIWLLQALPKWTVAVTADGQLSAQIMKVFVTPRADAEPATTTLAHNTSANDAKMVRR
jgi:hypothetical protein